MPERPLSEWMNAVQMSTQGGPLIIDRSRFGAATRAAERLEAENARLRGVVEKLIASTVGMRHDSFGLYMGYKVTIDDHFLAEAQAAVRRDPSRGG